MVEFVAEGEIPKTCVRKFRTHCTVPSTENAKVQNTNANNTFMLSIGEQALQESEKVIMNAKGNASRFANGRRLSQNDSRKHS